MRHIGQLFVLVVAAQLVAISSARGQTFAATKTWIAGSSTYTTPAKWTPSGVPATTDNILFPSSSYTVTFTVGAGSPPMDIVYSVMDLEVASSATVSFVPSTSPGNVTLAASRNGFILGALTLGSGSGMTLSVGDSLSVATQGSGTFLVQSGSDVITDVLNVNNGTTTVSGSGSTLTVNWLDSTNTTASEISTVIGNSGTGATLNLQTASTGNRIHGGLQIGGAASGTLTISGASTLALNSDPTDSPNQGFHDLFVGAQGLTGVNGTLNISDSGTTLTQSDGAAPSNITVGAATGGTGTITIAGNSNGATLTTGTGLLTINRTGTVNVSTLGGVTSILNANGDITVDGGKLNKAAAGTFNWVSGHTTTLIHGGVESIDTNGTAYNTPLNSTYVVNGFGSALRQTSEVSGAQLNIINGSQVSVSAAGTISSGGTLNIGTNGTGTLTVDGVGSFAAASASSTPSNFGSGGYIAQATFSNLATGLFTGGINMVSNTSSGTTAVVSVESGAVLTVGNLNVDSVGGLTSAILTVTGQGSVVKLAAPSSLVVGSASGGTATIYLNDLGDLNNSGGTTLNATGTININGGSAELGALTNNGGKINFTSGSLTYAGTLTIGSGGLLGNNFQLNTGSQLLIGGTTTVNSSASLTVEGGSFTTNTLVNSGNVTLDAGGVTLNNALTNQASGLFVVGQNRLAAVNNTSTNAGEIQLGGGGATLGGSGSLANTGLIDGDGIITNAVTNNAGGEIRAESGMRVKLTGASGSNLGKINLQGGTAEFTQAMTNGATSGQIIGRGTLIVGGAGLTNNGNIAFSGGTTDVFGDVHNSTGTSARGITISGNGSATFWDDVTNGVSAGDGTLFRVSTGSTATFFGTYSGSGVSGGGTVYYESDISPGFSPALVTYGGNVVLDSTARLKMELGGNNLGSQFDHVDVTGQLSLGGALNVVLINGFVPVQGNSFDLLNWGSLSGQFSSITLPALSSGLAWDSTQLYTNGTLAVANVGLLPGDFNRDGHVNAADIVVMEQALTDLSGYEQSHGGLMNSQVTTIGDLNSDGFFNNADLQALETYLIMGGGSIMTVPEPAGIELAMMGAALLTGVLIYNRKARMEAADFT